MPVMCIRVEKGYLRRPPALLLIASISPLVVEETNVLLDEGDAELLRCLEDGLVILATARSSNVLGSRLGSTVHIVGEWELDSLSALSGR